VPRLKAADVTRIIAESRGQKPRRYADGNSIYLVTTGNGGASWTYQFWEASTGRVRAIGLGSAADLSPPQARRKAEDFRVALRNGTAVLPSWRRAVASRASVVPGGETFAQAAATYLKSMESEWVPSEQLRYARIVEDKCAPFAAMAFASITPVDVANLLRPFWKGSSAKPGSITRSLIERILGAAAVRAQLHDYANPASWKSRQQFLLPKGEASEEHHASLPYAALPKLMRELAADDGEKSRAIRFLILTASRHSETVHALWEEIDLESKVWTIPAERAKNGKAHRVPLTPAAIALLGKPGDPDAHVWSANGLLGFLNGFGCVDDAGGAVTLHGFRSTFRDWAREFARAPDDVAELCLAHINKDKVEAAYKRGKLFDERRSLMEAYAAFAAKSVVA
jgi:integrase